MAAFRILRRVLLSAGILQKRPFLLPKSCAKFLLFGSVGCGSILGLHSLFSNTFQPVQVVFAAKDEVRTHMKNTYKHKIVYIERSTAISLSHSLHDNKVVTHHLCIRGSTGHIISLASLIDLLLSGSLFSITIIYLLLS